MASKQASTQDSETFICIYGPGRADTCLDVTINSLQYTDTIVRLFDPNLSSSYTLEHDMKETFESISSTMKDIRNACDEIRSTVKDIHNTCGEIRSTVEGISEDVKEIREGMRSISVKLDLVADMLSKPKGIVHDDVKFLAEEVVEGNRKAEGGEVGTKL